VPADSPLNTGESNVDFGLAQSLIYPQSLVVYQIDDIPNALGETGTTSIGNTFLDSIDESYCSYTAFGITGDSPDIDPQYPDTNFTGGYTGQRMYGVYQPTRVVSVSYGEAEAELPKSYVQRQCSEFT